MKKTNKLLSILLALAVVFTMALPTFAAGNGTITVENAAEGKEYKAYKIFDVVYDGDNYSYTMDVNSPWVKVDENDVATVQGYSGVTLTKSADGTVYVVTLNETFNAAEFAAALSAAGVTADAIKLTVADGKATATGLDLGYYLVTTTTGALCNLTTTAPSASIYDKNVIEFDKVDDDESVEVGQKVNYTLTGKVPSTTGYTTYTYKITDTMSDGLTFNNDVKVYVDGAELTENYTYTKVDNGFELVIDVMNLQDYANKEIKVTYSATVNANAVVGVENNSVKLEYSNDPTDETKYGEVKDEETVYTAEIIIDKYSADDETVSLEGAKFVLINNGTYAADGVTPNNANVGKFYKVDANGNVSWYALAEGETLAEAIKAGKVTEVTTDATGKATFKGLEDGKYLLRETAAPAGYNMLTEDVEVEIKAETTEEGGKTVVVETSLSVTEKVANDTGVVLPETGGIGTTIFYVIGGVLVAVAAVLLITRKRMSTEE